MTRPISRSSNSTLTRTSSPLWPEQILLKWTRSPKGLSKSLSDQSTTLLNPLLTEKSVTVLQARESLPVLWPRDSPLRRTSHSTRSTAPDLMAESSVMMLRATNVHLLLTLPVSYLLFSLLAKVEQHKTSTTVSTTVSATSGAKTTLEFNQTTPSGNAYVDRPVSSMRKIIADRLIMSKTTIPHYYLTSKIQMDDLMK